MSIVRRLKMGFFLTSDAFSSGEQNFARKTLVNSNHGTQLMTPTGVGVRLRDVKFSIW